MNILKYIKTNRQLQKQVQIQSESLTAHVQLQHKLQSRINELERVIDSENNLKETIRDIVKEGKI